MTKLSEKQVLLIFKLLKEIHFLIRQKDDSFATDEYLRGKLNLIVEILEKGIKEGE